MTNIKAGILGASGYTGSELIRILDRHPKVDLIALGAHRNAGQSAHDVFAHLPDDLPTMVQWHEMNLSDLDVLFAGLPHGHSAEILGKIYHQYPNLKLIDLSADFRFDDVAQYNETYHTEHPAPEILPDAVYGLSEINRAKIASARIVACTGCYCLSADMALIPLLRQKMIDTEGIIIDSKSGVSGAGRGAKAQFMFAEVSQGMHAYSIASHRHLWEIEQELSKAAGEEVMVSFTPHLIPMNRGILTTSYVQRNPKMSIDDLRTALIDFYRDEAFVRICAKGDLPKTQNVFGSNGTEIAVFADRNPKRAIIVTVIDNLQKGASGQAVQNMNIMFGLTETMGLDRIAQYP